MKNRCKKQCGNRKARKLDFDRFLIDLGDILDLQDGAKTFKIDVEMASKFHEFLEASWNTLFSTKKRWESRHPPASPFWWSRPGPTGGGFRRGKARRSSSKNL